MYFRSRLSEELPEHVTYPEVHPVTVGATSCDQNTNTFLLCKLLLCGRNLDKVVASCVFLSCFGKFLDCCILLRSINQSFDLVTKHIYLTGALDLLINWVNHSLPFNNPKSFFSQELGSI